MKAVSDLPQGYIERERIDFKHNRKLFWILNSAAVLLLPCFGVSFLLIAVSLNPHLASSGSFESRGWSIVIGIVLLVLSCIVCMIVHELIHSLCFWLFTGSRPHFGFKWLYAYASAPNWYIPRGPFLFVGLAPFVCLTLLGIALLPFVSAGISLLLCCLLTAHTMGCVGDFYVVIRLLMASSGLLIRDYGDGMAFYAHA
ncbi:DUF3267 domain-containing protein [Ktedonospora formicarum]|uniref:Transcriptional regulator n=1 Tax=Ktedonospora formicarum TaxID=2778364 RepID=A0A8J3I5E3_9CHLR|nr:DUF3267 domain-containing protein [Ktedonospora formicarum]GHO45694.1 transcriptional regulator [Ktedonospora formicarum]